MTVENQKYDFYFFKFGDLFLIESWHFEKGLYLVLVNTAINLNKMRECELKAN